MSGEVEGVRGEMERWGRRGEGRWGWGGGKGGVAQFHYLTFI